MSKLIWKLYNDNMISMEVAIILLDKQYEQKISNAFESSKLCRY